MSWQKIGVVVAIVGVVVSYQQLDSSIKANEREIAVLQQHLNQTKISISTQPADGYLSKPQLIAAKGIINARTNNGKDYSSIASDQELESAILSILNYLQTLATGISTSHTMI